MSFQALRRISKGITSRPQRFFGAEAPQNDKLCYPQGKPTHNKHLQGNLLCHSEGARSATEESLLSARESLSKTPKSTTGDSLRDISGLPCCFIL
ncbi:hypothetical protein [Helicobacter marmotae]|uniref:hypothetical protein n=1 Tax=Helicobacter marmotae TaxID=152490 RepID=UPI0011C0703C|nr:hypothetical protein [Helicobacter marmotae]